MRTQLVIIMILLLVSCGGRGKAGAKGSSGGTVFGANAVSTGVDFADIEPGLACASGGLSVFTFRDLNADGLKDADEEIIKVKSLCNGINGTSSTTTVESFASSSSCPQGGVKIASSGNAAVEVCNGADGSQGLQGAQGEQGLAGANGSVITPVKFCPTDNSTYPEYGLIIDGELFAVYWGVTPASPNVAQAFLTKLVAGNYRSTGGNNCLFSVP